MGSAASSIFVSDDPITITTVRSNKFATSICNCPCCPSRSFYFITLSMCYKRSNASVSLLFFFVNYSCSEFFCVFSDCALLLVLTSLRGRYFVF
jgi:hypothetical protein